MGVRDVSFDRFLEAADQCGISRMCISSIGSTMYDADEGNRFTRELAQKHPDRLIPFASVPYAQLGQKGLDAIERAVESWGFRGIGEIMTDHSDPLDHPYWVAVLEKAAQYKIPVLVHANSGPCARAAQQVPEATILLAHIGTGLGEFQAEWVDAILMAKSHPNVYLEICTSILADGMIEDAVSAVGAGRVIFGTDSPLLDPSVQLAKITSAEIPEDDKIRILSTNMHRILNL
jgi:predicted TIM-barrel fold metal-dependent hydrolase